MFCPRCGAPNRAQAKRCASCAAGLTPQGVEPGRPRRVNPAAPSARPVPQAPSTQRAPAPRRPRRATSALYRKSELQSPDGPPGGLRGIEEQPTLLEGPNVADLLGSPEQQPTPEAQSPIGLAGFTDPTEAGAQQSATLIAPTGGAERRAWQDVAEASANPAQQRFATRALNDSFGRIEVGTDPETTSSPSVDATRQVPALKTAPVPPPPTTADLQPGRPQGTRKLPVHRARQTPQADLRTHSLPSIDEEEEPPNEPTRLGALAGTPHPALAPAPVIDAPKDVGRPSETVAAPGELAGLIEDLQARARPSVGHGPPEPPGMVPDQTLGTTPSMMRRGLQSHLPKEAVDRTPLSQTDHELDVPDEILVAPVQSLNGAEPSRPLEDTHALLDNFDGPSIPSDPTPLLGLLEPPPLMARNDTGPMAPVRATDPTQVPPQPEVPQWEVASRTRRISAQLLDLMLLLSALGVPILVGAFGEALAETSPIDPDQMASMMMQGELTFPLIVGAFLAWFYIVVGTFLGGRSLGKLAFGLQVVRTKDGGTPGVGRALVRGTFALVGTVFAGAGPMLTLVDTNCRALHDKFAGTTVVRSGSNPAKGV